MIRPTTAAAALAIAASSFATSLAAAAGFGGITVVASPARVVSSVSQTTTAATLTTLGLRVTLCSGTVEAPAFVATSATNAVATGSVYTIRATIVNATTTRFDVVHTGGATGIALIELGGSASQIGFDRVAPNPGTNGSSTGADFSMSAVLSVGAWNAYALYRNPVNLVGAAALGDLFGGLQVRFTSCFSAGDRLVFDTDTDSIH